MAIQAVDAAVTVPVEDAGAIDHALALGFRRVEAVETLALQLADLGDIDLPPVLGSAADRAHLQTVAPLYLASELEAAGLLPAVEVLAGLVIGGGLPADMGPAGPKLAHYWQARRQRFTAAERQAIFARLFGDPAGPPLAVPGARNTSFEPLFIDLAEALYRQDASPLPGTMPPGEAALRVAAGQLAANLIPRSGGIAAYAARDILATIEEAIVIFKEPSVQQALGARSLWTAVRNIANRYLREDPDISSRVTRGKSGMLIIAWLSESLGALEDTGQRLLRPGEPVIGAAGAWLQASLSLREQEAAAEQRG